LRGFNAAVAAVAAGFPARLAWPSPIESDSWYFPPLLPVPQCPGTLVNVLFQGSVLNTVTCLACGHESKTWDPIQVRPGATAAALVLGAWI
jgi:hypothetical protein